MDIQRQMERDQAEYNEKHRKSSYYHGENDRFPQNFQVLTNDQFVLFQPIDSRQMLNDAPPTLGYAQGYNNNDTCELLYKIFRGDTKLVRSMLEANYFSHTESHEWNILWSSGSCKSYLYEGLNEHQKINHFPSSQEITRKDKLAININKMQHRFGKAAFDFLPDTYVIPDEFGDFYRHFQKQQQSDPKRNMWIVKPTNLSRGRGIYIIDDISEVNVEELSIISRYIANPLLINGHKFDLRIYVCVTSIDPLRIYVFKEGLARFATQEYSSNAAKGNKFTHLTNYSINKKSQNYVHNDNLENDDFGFKWSLSAFCKHLEQINIDMDLFWSRIFDVIIKSLLSAEHHILAASKKTCIHRTNCYEVYGFDIMIDSDFKPWLIEINLSPSLACDSQIDMKIKSQLLADTFNLIGVRQFDRKAESANKAKNRMKSYQNRGKSTQGNRYNGIFNPLRDLQNLNNQLGGAFNSFMARSIGGNRSGSQDNVSINFTQQANMQTIKAIESLQNDGEFAQDIDMLKKLSTLKHKEILRETLLELLRKGNYVCIYPARGSEHYDQYFQQVRPLNRFLNRVLFQNDMLDQMKLPKFRLDDSTPEQVPKKMTNGADCSSAKIRRSQDGVNFKTIKDQLQDIQNVAKNAEMHLAQMSVKNSNTSTSLSLHPKGSNSSKLLQTAQQAEDQTPSKSSKFSFFRSGNTVSSQKKLSKGEQSHPELEQTNTYLIDETGVHQVASQQSPNGKQSDESKVVISGDDILIEYCERLRYALRKIPDGRVRPAQQAQLIRFITHYVWQMQDKVDHFQQKNSKSMPQGSRSACKNQVSFHARIQNRLVEMKERRRRLIRIQLKNQKESGGKNFAAEFSAILKRKQAVLYKFDSNKLESVLKESTKATALELVLTLLPKTARHGILVDLEVSFGIKVDPMSPSYSQKKSGQLDANGNLIKLTESSSVTMTGETDEDEIGSPSAMAYSDKKKSQRLENSDKQPLSTTGLGRTATGFSSSTTYSNQQSSSQMPKKQKSASGVVMLQDLMLDRSQVQLIGKSAKNKQPVLTMNRNELQQSNTLDGSQDLQKKSSKAQLYEQNILNAIRTNNFFMSSNAPNQGNDSMGFKLTKNTFNSSIPAKKFGQDQSSQNKTLSHRNTQNSQQSLGNGSKRLLQEPGMIHNAKFPPTGHHQNQNIKTNRLPPTNYQRGPMSSQSQRRPIVQLSKAGDKSSYYQNQMSNPLGQNRNGSFGLQGQQPVQRGLSSCISDYNRANGEAQKKMMRRSQQTERNSSQPRGGQYAEQQRFSGVTRSNTIFNQQETTKKRMLTSGQSASGQIAIGNSSGSQQPMQIVGNQGLTTSQGAGAGGGGLLNSGRNPSKMQTSSEFNSNQRPTNNELTNNNKMQNRIKSAVIGQRTAQD